MSLTGSVFVSPSDYLRYQCLRGAAGLRQNRGREDVEQRPGGCHCQGRRQRNRLEERGEGSCPYRAAMLQDTKQQGAVQAAGRAVALPGGDPIPCDRSPAFSWGQEGFSQGLSVRPGCVPPTLCSALLAGRSQGVRCAAQPALQVLGEAPPEAPCGQCVLLKHPGPR